MLSLRSKITQKILGYVFLHERSALYVNEMCRRFNVDRGNLVRKLAELEMEGVLKSEWRGNQRYYSLNSSFPLLREYKRIVLKTVGFEGALKKVLKEIPGIQKALLFGSYAKDRMDLSSDLDLLVVGDHNTVELQKKLADLQKTMDRELNVISMSSREYEKKRRTSSFLKSVLRTKRISIL